MSRVFPAGSLSSPPKSSTLTNVSQMQASAPNTVRVIYKVVGSPTVTSNSTVVVQSGPAFTSNNSATGLPQNTKNICQATVQNKGWTVLQMSNGESYFVKKPDKNICQATVQNKGWTVLQMSNGESHFVKKPDTNTNTPTSSTEGLPFDPKILATGAQNYNSVVNKQNASLSPCVTYSNCGTTSNVLRKTTAPGVCTVAVQANSNKETKTHADHCGTPIAKDVNNLKILEVETDLSPREKRIRRLKEMVKAKEEEIEKIRQEINSNTTTCNASATEVTNSATSSSFVCSSLSSLSESSSLLAKKTSNPSKKLLPRKKPQSQKRSDQTFSPDSGALPFLPDASDRLFRQLCGLEIVVDCLCTSESTSGTNSTHDTSAS